MRKAVSPARRERRVRAGFSTVDAILALAVSAVLAAGALALFDRGTSRVREQRFVQQVAMLAQGVRGLYENAGAPPYGPAGSVDISARIFALGLGTQESRTATSYVNAYGQAMQITTDGPWFSITSLVPTEACITSWQKMPALYGLRITGGGGTADLLAPIDSTAMATIRTACSGAARLNVSYRFQ